jgi:hypothetical protein
MSVQEYQFQVYESNSMYSTETLTNIWVILKELKKLLKVCICMTIIKEYKILI